MEMLFLISNDQMRDARALLRWSVREFSEKSGVSTATIERLENGRYEMGEAKINTMKSIIRTLEAGGIEFLPDGSVRRRQG